METEHNSCKTEKKNNTRMNKHEILKPPFYNYSIIITEQYTQTHKQYNVKQDEQKENFSKCIKQMGQNRNREWSKTDKQHRDKNRQHNLSELNGC